jgi:diguanylate cyclase (GGDEF)-like protein
MHDNPEFVRRTDPGGWFDPVTGLQGPAFLDAVMAVESARCVRYGRKATVVAVELGGMDELTATWGSEVTGRALKHVAAVLRAGARSSDYLARTDRWRFGLILPETDEVAAVNFIERVRSGCEHALRAAGPSARCSFGWADARNDRALADASAVAIERARSESVEADRPEGDAHADS